MNKKEHKIQDGKLILLSMLSGLLLGLLLHPADRSTRVELTKLDQAMHIIQRHYVDPVDRDSLTDELISLMASSLDPHSHYATAADLLRDEPSMSGQFEGIGIILFPKDDTICVLEAIPGGPSEKAGLLPGDRLLRADTVGLVGLPSDRVISHLRGPRRSVVELTIKRPGIEGQRHVRIVRDKVATPSILYAGMLDHERGYIILQRFCETSHAEFRQAVTSLKQQGMKHLILDLRGNGGGLLSAALSIADELLPGRELILYSEGAHQRRESHRSTPGGLWAQGQLTVMVDEYSASASEIIAGTIQDNDRGLIVGRRTFGKGLVQRQFYLKDGSCLFLTTSRYHTPSGRCIQRPYDKGTDEYYADYLLQLASEYGGDTSLLRPTDTTRYFTSSGRVVYGGGGILPDKPLKIFTDSLLVYYNELSNKDLFRRVAFDYVSLHVADLRAQYPTAADFERRFDTPPALLDQVVERGRAMDIQPNARTLARYAPEMRQRIKAYISECLFDTPSFYRILIPYDHDLQTILKLKDK